MGDSLADRLLTTPAGGVLQLGEGDFFGQLVIDRAVCIEGQGYATWLAARIAPVIRIVATGVVLRNLRVALVDTQGAAIEASLGSGAVLDEVWVEGDVIGVARANYRPATSRITIAPAPLIGFPGVESAAPVMTGVRRWRAEEIDQLMEEARELRSAGRLAEAVQRYEQVLRLNPGHPDAVLLLKSTRHLVEARHLPIQDAAGVAPPRVGARQPVRPVQPRVDVHDGRLRLEIYSPGRPDLELELRSARVLIGSARSADVVLDDPCAAPKHAAVILAPDGSVQVEELAGAAGTLRNGTAVARRQRLTSGDHLLVGRIGIVVRFGNDGVKG